MDLYFYWWLGNMNMNGRPYKSRTKNLFINFWQGAILGPATAWALILNKLLFIIINK